MSGDIATYCDGCGEDIAYDETCYAVPNGEVDGMPCVRIVCATCHDYERGAA